MKKAALVGICAAAAVGFAARAEQKEAVRDNRVRLLFATVETPDTRTDKMQEAVIMPVIEPTYSAAALQKMTGAQLEAAQRQNRHDVAANNKERWKLTMKEYERRVKLQQEIARKSQGTAVGRNVVLARDWFIAAMGKYAGCFLLVSRVDDQQRVDETFFTGADVLDVEKSSFFVKLILNDPSQSRESVQTAGGNTLTRITTGQLITVQVQNLRNEVVFTKDVEVSKVAGASSVRRTTGDDDTLGKVLREGFGKVADEVAAAFPEELTVMVKGPKGDADFDAEDVALTLDGKDIVPGQPVRVVKALYAAGGRHLVRAGLDGYETVERAVTGSVSVTMKKTAVKDAE
jgi:hypothetical protein